MAEFPVRLTAIAVGVALLAGAASARAGDSHPAKPTKTAKGVTKPAGKGPDAAGRRAIAGGPTSDDVSAGVESPELRTLRDAERELFPPAAPAPGNPWPTDVPLLLPGDDAPQVHATGLPPAAPIAPPAPEASPQDLAWLSKLELPDLPVRWDERVVRYLQFFRDDPRGHATLTSLLRRSGRYGAVVRRALHKKGLPEDLMWVAMIESGFDPTAKSHAGAVGLWQFMPETARIYGLSVDRWIDQRMAPGVATEAAADFLADLHRRFGSWDLALAAYDMGYGGVSSVVRRFNTNDFWSLARTEGSLPWETTLYVPKILATAVVSHNLGVFGFSDLQLDAAVETDEVAVPPGTPLALVAQAVGATPKEVGALNPELRAARTPPLADGDGAAYPVKVPAGKGGVASQVLAKAHKEPGQLEKYVVRFGETLEQIATAHKTTAQKLVELNAIGPGEAVRGGTVLLVPAVDGAAATSAPAPAAGTKQSVVVPADVFVYPDRRRVFYRVLACDTLDRIAAALHVGRDDLDRWNDIDPGARLQEGMTLQAFVPQGADLSGVAVTTESDVRVLAVGSDEFFAALEQDRGIRRVVVTAREGDTLEGIGKRYGVSLKAMERVNRRGRTDALRAGETVVVYVPTSSERSAPPMTASNAPAHPSAAVPDIAP